MRGPHCRQTLEELPGPEGDVLLQDGLAHRLHPAADVLGIGVVRRLERRLHAVDVVGVDQPGLPQLVGGTGELREHQGAVTLEPARDVLLGDQVHAVAERGHDHDVGGAVEGSHLVLGVRRVQVRDDGTTDPAQVAVDPADEAVDVVTEDPVLLDALARRRRDLDEDGVLDVEPAVADQLAEGPQPRVDALGVVEPVDAEEDPVGVAELGADLGGALGHRVGGRELLEDGGVDGDGEGGGLHAAAVG